MEKGWRVSLVIMIILIIGPGTGSPVVDQAMDRGKSVLAEVSSSLPVLLKPSGTNCSDMIREYESFLPDNRSFDQIIRPIINDTGLICVVACQDGKILYSSNPLEINKIPPDNVETEFPTFRDVISLMIIRESGSQYYDIWNPGPKDPVSRRAIWNTVSIQGIEWRIMIGVPL